MEKKKIVFDNALLYYIKTLKNQELINTWMEGAEIYYKITGKEISANKLSAKCKNIIFSEVNPYDYANYLKKTKELTSKKEKESHIKEVKEKNGKNALTVTLAIKSQDYAPIFGIDVHKDSPEEIIHKIRNKISDDNFLLSYLGFNPGSYEVEKFDIGSWATTLKLKQDGKVFPKKIMNDKFSVTIKKRKNSKLYYTEEECKKFLSDFLSENKITPFDFFFNDQQFKENSDLNKNQIMVCPGLELHLGKLGSTSDFEDYSSKQALWRIKKVAEEIVKYQRQEKCAELVLGIGNDYFNSDTVDDKTTAGTQQNNDTRFKEIYLNGKIGYFQLIESIKNEFNKIYLKHNPGNHDEKTSFSLYSNLYDIYTMTNDPKVSVNIGFKDIRYNTCQVFGKNVIIFMHGKASQSRNLNDKDLAGSVRNLFPKEISTAENVYIFAGHLHSDSMTKIDKTNITVIRSAALTGIDEYHSDNLYLGQREGHTLYVLDKDRGLVGTRYITLTPEERIKKIPSSARKPDSNVQEEIKKALNLTNETIRQKNVKERINVIDDELNSYDALILKIASFVKKYDDEDKVKMKKQILDEVGLSKRISNLELEKSLLLKK